MIQPLLVFSDWGILLLRLALGAIMVRHGLPKLKNLQMTAQGFAGMGFRPGIFWGTLVGAVEFVGGLCLIFGLITQVAALLIAGQFLIILLKLKKGKIFAGDVEFDLLIFTSALILATLGAGTVSLDSFWRILIY